MKLALLAAILVRALLLPPHATIDPFGSRSLMAASAAGEVAASVTVDGYARRIAVWAASGRVRQLPATGTVAGYDLNGALLIDAAVPMRAGRYGGVPLDLRSCEIFRRLRSGRSWLGCSPTDR